MPSYYSKPNDVLWNELVELIRDIRSVLSPYVTASRNQPVADADEPASPTSELLTISQVSQLLHISPSVLQNWRLTGQGPPSYKLGSRVRYRQAEVQSWLDDQRLSARQEQLELERESPRRIVGRRRGGAFCSGSDQPPGAESPYEGRVQCSVCRDHLPVRNDQLVRKHYPL